MEEDEREDFDVVHAAALTLLGLLIGFTFSMAINRYDQRKNYEEAEANAIGTEYLRVGLLPPEDAAAVRGLLRKYIDQRLLFYTTRDEQSLRKIDSDTTQLQNELWSIVQTRAVAQPTPIAALAASGMNDVLNSQGYTQAAWWNRIPTEAWILLCAISIGCNFFIVLPLAVSISFFLIADIDSPHSGMIRVQPHNLLKVSQSLR